MSRFVSFLLAPRGSRMVDILLRGSAVLALAGIVAVLRWPGIAPMLGFFFVTLFVNGPLGPLLPAAYEPVLILMGRVYPPLLVAVVGITGVILVDWLDYYLYRAILLHPVLDTTRQSWLMRQAVRLFARAPFLTVFICATGILPHIAVRVLAPVANYPVGRYLLATFLGRFPRLWFFAALGAVVPVSTQVLIMMTIAMFIVPLAVMGQRAWVRRNTPPAPLAEVA